MWAGARVEQWFLFKTSYSPIGLPWWLSGKESIVNAGDIRDRLGRSPGAGNGKLLQYSCLENSMDRGTWRAIVHEVAKSQTRLSSHVLSSIMAFKSLGVFLLEDDLVDLS